MRVINIEADYDPDEFSEEALDESVTQALEGLGLTNITVDFMGEAIQ